MSGVSERTIRRVEAIGNAESATLLSILDALETNLKELENMFNEDNTMKEESKERNLLMSVSFIELKTEEILQE